ncbi:MAG: hypothetical protein ACR2PO_04715 [Methyloligellaceae bacterium]
MGLFSRRTRRGDITKESSDIARRSRRGAGAAVVSGFALIFSAISLYETVLRQPDLSVYVSPVIHYTRENGGEVLAVPVTIANRGARDGTVLSMDLTADSPDRPDGKVFYSAYFVGSGYFLKSRLERSATGGLQITKQRPKTPFAPLSIAGRGNYSGTILFFAKGKESPRLISKPGEFGMTLRLNTRFDDGMGWLDQVWQPRAASAAFRVKLNTFNARGVERGDTIEMKSANWQ